MPSASGILYNLTVSFEQRSRSSVRSGGGGISTYAIWERAGLGPSCSVLPSVGLPLQILAQGNPPKHKSKRMSFSVRLRQDGQVQLHVSSLSQTIE